MLMRTWTNEQLAILDSEYPTANLKELAGRLDKTPEAVKAKALIRKLKRSPDVRVWSPVKRQKLIALYPDHTNLEIASMLGSTESAVAGMAFKLKLRKSAKFLFEHSSKGFFPKGHQPMNKGRKQTEYMSDAQIEKTKATRFKKGCIPKNHKEVGYEPEKEKISVKVQLKAVMQNRPYLLALVGQILFGFTLYGRNADILYYFTYVEGNVSYYTTYSM